MPPLTCCPCDASLSCPPDVERQPREVSQGPHQLARTPTPILYVPTHPPTQPGIGGAVNLILSRGDEPGNTGDLLIDIEPLDPTENAFTAHQKMRAAVERISTW